MEHARTDRAIEKLVGEKRKTIKPQIQIQLPLLIDVDEYRPIKIAYKNNHTNVSFYGYICIDLFMIVVCRLLHYMFITKYFIAS